MKYEESKQNLKHLCRNPLDLAVIEYVTPYKISVALLLHEFIRVKSCKFRQESCENLQSETSEIEETLLNSVVFDSMQRKDFCTLLLKSIQSVDLSFADFAKKLLYSELEIHAALKAAWKYKLALLVSDPLPSLMSLMTDFERLICDSHDMPYLHRLSISGLFIRRILLGFEKLSFTEVSNFAASFKQYYTSGFHIIFKHDQESIEESQGPLLSYYDEMSKITEKFQMMEDDFVHISENTWTQKQGDLYVSKQVALLQYSEMNADSPAEIESTVSKIIQTNPDLSQVHFLAYLNGLRCQDFCSAIKSLYWSFDRGCQCEIFHNPDPDVEKMNEEADRGFRYAALNLAALHANFQHGQESIISALKEAIMMAQEANDHLCLQHALTWLFRVNSDQNKHFLMQRCISKCNSLGLSYLTSLGIQSLSQVVALSQEIHGSPSTVMDNLSKSDLLNCQHSLIELILASYAQKASFWTMYGRGGLSSMTCQLLLNIDSSDPSRHNFYINGEANAIALSVIAQRLFDQGQNKECDTVLTFAKTLFPRDSSLCGHIVKSTQLQIDFLRCLHQTDWTGAKHCIQICAANCQSQSEPLFLKLQLFIAQANDLEASEICQKLTGIHQQLSPLDKVRSFLYQAEVFCLTTNFSDAISPLMKAMKITSENNLDYFHALVILHSAHIQVS